MPETTAPAKDDVYEHVRNAILNGDLRPGAVMSQVVMAEQLGISRTPLREALRLLQGEGLIESEPNRRVKVAAMTARDLESLCVIRVTLEAEMLRLSVPVMSSEDIARLEGYMAEMAHFADEQDYVRWTAPHRAFHRTLTEHAGTRVNVFLGQLFDHAERYRRLHFGRTLTAWTNSEHRDIVDACKARDRDAAGALLASHLARVGFEICELLDESYDPTQLQHALLDTGAEVPGRFSRKRPTSSAETPPKPLS
jgi:DNA-binding GntR family transcriptional regulator